MELAFATLDVFTTKQLEGNPLAVVRVPASLRGRVTQSLKQKITQEFNLSETVFLHDGQEAREIDIFTIDRPSTSSMHVEITLLLTQPIAVLARFIGLPTCYPHSAPPGVA
ncbi:hypothetical protein NUW58_g3932 [Xylaria curta]|uniref:Uncharacterized protein n=1 Tax=Xylaria curta TaxID=42375 RepID=A0ACC1PBD1_9PEZI|nr:hypothetical protein NUW58_g3932 [Xylaria curta]